MCGLIIKLFEVPPLAEIRQDKKKKDPSEGFKVTAAFSRASLVYLTLSGVRDVCSGDRNVSKHAIISKDVVPYVTAEASQEKYGYLSGGNVQLFCFHGGKCCSKVCAASVKSTASLNSSHTRDRKDDSLWQRCVHACVLQR